jgi:opacity protein-like surface antigen
LESSTFERLIDLDSIQSKKAPFLFGRKNLKQTREPKHHRVSIPSLKRRPFMQTTPALRTLAIIAFLLSTQMESSAQSLLDGESDTESAGPIITPFISPAPPLAPIQKAPEQGNINWSGLFTQSFAFIGVEEGFRLLTENGALHSHTPFVRGYTDSVANLHGWGDGDPFLVNYVGHPMQGAVSGFIWVENDRRYRSAEFGRNRQYWKSRLRAAAFAWAYSEAEEIGPISEASIGATQANFPQQGFADHVVTPSIGMAWMITEDAVDKYIIARLEDHIPNPYFRAVLRGGLNPSRTLANALGGYVPWSRNTRPDVWPENSRYYVMKVNHSGTTAVPDQAAHERGSYPAVAPFEFSTITLVQQNSTSAGPCIGGGADAALRWNSQLQIVFELAGCKMTGLQTNLSGDSLQYLVGPRWTPTAASRWSPYVQLLAGGQKITHETIDHEEKAALTQALQAAGKALDYPDHALYTSDRDGNAFAFKAGAGVDVRLTSALAFRLVGLDYMYSRLDRLDGIGYGQGMQVTTGLVLRMGTW